MGRESWGGDTLETLMGIRESIIGYAAGRVGRDEAEDIAQDVALRALEASNKKVFSSREHYRNWLFTITRNRCISILRRKINFGFETGVAETADWEPLPEQQYLSKEGLEELEFKLQKLKPQLRVVFHLRYFLDLEYTDIARILGISAGTARQRNFRGLKILRDLLPDEY